ncbi:MAG: HAMP domain-containing protein [Betaproteobacteria bacterium]|nr:HAMP domain-containing protein [Betaproteobacteria bacterium]
MPRHQALGVSLFWRTFILLAVLLAGGVFSWLQTLRALEFEPRAIQAAQQTAGLVNLARAALKTSDGINRVALLKSLALQGGTRVTPREPNDQWETYETDRFSRRVSQELRSALGPDAVVAGSVNGVRGMWVGFSIDREQERDRFWLQAESAHAAAINRETWLTWTGIALLATLVGSVAIASLINRPLKQLSFAASRIRDGDLDSRLDENTLTSEIREVNMGFNRMARELARVEEDRAVMLAGISHDLRTPLARLRLETEMSVDDDEAKRNMALDIDQLDAIIDKFMDYARPGETRLLPVHLSQLIDREAALFRDPTQINITSRVAIDLVVLADETELGRVFLNLFENARRYGRGTYTGLAEVSVSYVKTGPWAIVTVRDQGAGVAPEKLPQLTTPFFRGDAARTAATGAGLGLAIVDKAMQRMGGTVEIANAKDGGLMVHLRLRRVTGDEPLPKGRERRRSTV